MRLEEFRLGRRRIEAGLESLSFQKKNDERFIIFVIFNTLSQPCILQSEYYTPAVK